MRHRGADSTAVRRAPDARAVLVLSLLLFAAVAAADPPASPGTGWRIEPRLYLSGITTQARKGDWVSTHRFVSTAAEFRFASPSHPVSAGLFADYRYALGDRAFDNLNLGGYLKRERGRWDSTAFLFASKPRHAKHTRIYAARIRYRVAPDHKLGLFASGSVDYPGSPFLGLGYFGSIRDSLSLNLVAGPGLNHGPDFVTQLELVWQLR